MKKYIQNSIFLTPYISKKVPNQLPLNPTQFIESFLRILTSVCKKNLL